MAMLNRQPDAGLVHHCDHGVRYAGNASQRQLALFGMTCVMSRVGNGYDNAVKESFWGTLKTEHLTFLRHSRWPNLAAAFRHYSISLAKAIRHWHYGKWKGAGHKRRGLFWVMGTKRRKAGELGGGFGR